jgi:pimeloyl-ACP methyl ester carboxylesterase
MPFDLAVTAINRADKLIEKYPSQTVIIGGHSLGGAMAARYALKHAEKLKGLILMGAFSAKTDDLSKLDLATLVLAAQNDGLATLSEVRDGLKRLPEPQLVEIPGSVHAFFGRYGPQQGDGIPTVSRDQAEDDIATILRTYFENLIPQ